MNKLLLSFVFLTAAQAAFGQSKWDKSSSTALEDDCITYLSKTYKNLDETQKELLQFVSQKILRLNIPPKRNMITYPIGSFRELKILIYYNVRKPL